LGNILIVQYQATNGLKNIYRNKMRKKIVAGNWKMNLLSDEANTLFHAIGEEINSELDVQVMVFPPAIYLSGFLTNVSDSKVKVGAQNFYPADQGAFTGEIAVKQLKDLGVNAVLIGHSERRSYFLENAAFLKEKVDKALENRLEVVFCCGEPLEIREAGEEQEYVKQQLIDSLFHLTSEEIVKCVIAYEPVWAIGTGKTASVEQAEEMHRNIRSWIKEKYDVHTAESISILYGGSCNAANANELFACPNVDGGLIGGAALDKDAFLQIINSF
jgi:triosephosphate isomerase (TIM)